MRATGWNFGDILDGIEPVLPPEAPALIHGDEIVTWSELSARSNRLAHALRDRGARPGDKVAFYLRNRNEYLLALAACFKARLVHVNVNYRYLDEELHYILDNSDAKVVLFDAEFGSHVEALRSRLPGVAAWLRVGDGPLPGWAEDFGVLARDGDASPLDEARSPDDLLFLYTGGTTGMPKGVMWRHEDLWGALGAGGMISANANVPPATLDVHVKNIATFGAGATQLPACPLMHGTGLFTSINNLMGGGCCVTLPGHHFSAEELFDVVDSRGVEAIVIVGDAFARPMLNALEANPGRWRLDSLKVVMSSGVMWSHEVKQGLLKHAPNVLLADLFGSSEAMGFGSSITSKAGGSTTATFRIGPGCKVFTEDHREVVPGSGERGFVARSGPIPLGYYKDPEKSARTFPVIDGVRYSVPGDWCTVEADGTLNLLGRGSACINTAGEKVYPEEVEETLKTHPAVEDALVVGVPDEKWGQAVTAVVELRPGAEVDEEALRQHVRERLAHYKAPKRVLPVPRMFRAPNGKADYKAALAYAQSA